MATTTKKKSTTSRTAAKVEKAQQRLTRYAAAEGFKVDTAQLLDDVALVTFEEDGTRNTYVMEARVAAGETENAARSWANRHIAASVLWATFKDQKDAKKDPQKAAQMCLTRAGTTDTRSKELGSKIMGRNQTLTNNVLAFIDDQDNGKTPAARTAKAWRDVKKATRPQGQKRQQREPRADKFPHGSIEAQVADLIEEALTEGNEKAAPIASRLVAIAEQIGKVRSNLDVAAALG